MDPCTDALGVLRVGGGFVGLLMMGGYDVGSVSGCCGC